MKYCIAVGFLSIFFLQCYGQTNKKAIETIDSVSVNAIPYPCFLFDKPAGFQVLSASSIMMKAGKETDLHNPANGSYFRNNAPKFLFTPDSNFEFSAKIKPDFKNLYDGGAILIYSDKENWAKILFQNTNTGLLLGNSVVKNKITDDSYYNIPGVKEIYLRVTKRGKVYGFYSSVDGKQWSLVREFVYHKPENMKIGFYSQSPVGPACEVEYSDIKYSKQ